MRAFIYFLTLLLSIQIHASEKLIITGSSTIAPLLSDLAKLFEKNHTGVRIDVQTGGSSRGVADTRNKVSNIGMVSRKLKNNENDLTNYTIAKDGIAIIVHKSNPVTELSEAQIQKIYTGTITNWKEVGGADKNIVVVNKAEGRSTLELFLNYFNLKNSNIKADVIIGDNEQGIKTVSKNPFAIGYVSIGTAEYNTKAGVPLRLLKYKGIEATVENVESGEYPITRELNLVINKNQGKVGDQFIQFATSDKATDIIREHYFVPTTRRK